MTNPEYIVRWSKKGDEQQIANLLHKAFGDMAEKGNAYNGIEDGRYLCAVTKSNAIIAITGLQHHTVFNGIEISWTTTMEEYRHNGIMQDLFIRLLHTTDQPIYCECWRIGNSDRVNLQTIMNMFDFHEVIPVLHGYDANINCTAGVDCPYRHSKCICSTGLFRREGKK